MVNLANDWNGPNDPDNPRNFPRIIRLSSMVAVTLLAFTGSFAGAIYAPAQEQIMQWQQCTYEVAILPLSLYNLGLAFGPIIGAPLSETYGRKAVFVVTTPLCILFLLGGGLTTTIASLSVCRFFAGVFASPNINNASAVILDYSAPHSRGVSLGMYYSVPSLGASIAPLVGGFIVPHRSWRWTQWVAILVTGGFYIPVLFTRETYKKVILRRRAIALGLTDAYSSSSTPKHPLRYFFTVLIHRPIHMLLTEPIVSFVSLYNGLIYGLLYTFVTSIPWIFATYYDFGPAAQSLSYLGVTVGTVLACAPFALIDIRFYQRRLQRWKSAHGEGSQLPPQNRLLSALVGSIPLPASLFIAGWAAEYRVHWIVPIVFQGVAMLSCFLVYAGANLFMLDVYGPLYSARGWVGDQLVGVFDAGDGADSLVFLGLGGVVEEEESKTADGLPKTAAVDAVFGRAAATPSATPPCTYVHAPPSH
ncbi:hypothetical protein FE257_009457 [Aspergillus nanangensis]|uniref:Major facilitator superfamily (MFS) profile domain-containing protein n=1 Tax=Aspergillus nanangensis TaxID=2582783 RepID=A0AAD4GST8_ASPNN|nr:hypothetical protein FE257_009457 [Aspergillus nanangensis]